ncbi:hypothetical protein ACFXN6_33575, partial [Streptomyces sp. NPDC059159]
APPTGGARGRSAFKGLRAQESSLAPKAPKAPKAPEVIDASATAGPPSEAAARAPPYAQRTLKSE